MSDTKKILEQYKNNEISIEEAEQLIKTQNILELENYAKLDNYRTLRTGFPEAIYAEGKTDDDLVNIILNCSNENFLVTRLYSLILMCLLSLPLIPRSKSYPFSVSLL